MVTFKTVIGIFNRILRLYVRIVIVYVIVINLEPNMFKKKFELVLVKQTNFRNFLNFTKDAISET